MSGSVAKLERLDVRRVKAGICHLNDDHDYHDHGLDDDNDDHDHNHDYDDHAYDTNNGHDDEDGYCHNNHRHHISKGPVYCIFYD